MYEFLKMLQPVAEQIGEITKVYMRDWRGDQIAFEGMTADGKPFELVLTVKEAGDAE